MTSTSDPANDGADLLLTRGWWWRRDPVPSCAPSSWRGHWAQDVSGHLPSTGKMVRKAGQHIHFTTQPPEFTTW